MKETIITLLFVFIAYFIISVGIEENIVIPEDSIRIRILANSNSKYDQNIKSKVKVDIQNYMADLLSEVTTNKEAEKTIIKNLENIDRQVENSLQSLDYKLPYKINFGLNYFPEKDYKGVKYNSGYYESLLITLGEGKGDNWWCVLFPPLCLIEAEESTEVEYSSFVKEILDKYV